MQLGKYRGIDIEHPVLKIADADIDTAILDMRGRFASHETVDGAKAEDGDQVIIDFDGKIDGEAFAGGTAESYPYILGSGRFFTEFETALQGAEAGGELTCDVTFPDDYSNTSLAGKTANFTIKVNEVKRKITPDFDDDFAKQAGFDDAATMRERVTKDLQESSSEQGRAIAEGKAMEKIVADSTFELPASLVESSANEYYEQEQRRLTALRVPYAEIEEREEELRAKARENAERNIKTFIAVNEIGDAENIEVTEDDFLKEADAIRKRTGMELDVVSRYLRQQDQMSEYRSRIYRQKAMEVIWNNANITQKEVTREELEAENEQEDA